MAKKQIERSTVATAVNEMIKPYPTFTDMGTEVGAQYFTAADRAARVALTIGTAYDVKTGIPKWGSLPAALESAGIKATREDIMRGIVARWDAQPDYTGGKAKALAAVGMPDGMTWWSMSAAAKQAHGKGNDARQEAGQALTTALNKCASDSWNGVVLADNRANGRITPRGSNKVTDVEKSLRGTAVERLPARVAKLVTDGFEVDTFWKDLAASIVKAKRADVEKKSE